VIYRSLDGSVSLGGGGIKHNGLPPTEVIRLASNSLS